MRLAPIAAAAAAIAALWVVPAAACTVIATPRICAPNGDCSGPLAVQAQREQEERQAIEYGRAMAAAVDARREAPGLDRAADISALVFPLVVSLVDFAGGGSCGPEVEGSIGLEDQRATAAADVIADLRARAGLPADGEPPRAALTALAALRRDCQQEAGSAFAAYLASAIPGEQLAEVWDFLLPRAGPMPPPYPRERLPGWRFAVTGASPGALAYNPVDAPPHIDRRRERAWQYLENHRDGRAVMTAVRQFLASRAAPGLTEAAFCPAAAGEMQALFDGLARR